MHKMISERRFDIGRLSFDIPATATFYNSSRARYTGRVSQTKLKQWSVLEVQKLADLGFFQATDKIELIEGAIVELSPQNVDHSLAISHGNGVFVECFGKTHYIRVQLPLNVGANSQPEPDFAIVSKAVVDNSARTQPDSAALVVEVSESSLAFD